VDRAEKAVSWPLALVLGCVIISMTSLLWLALFIWLIRKDL